MTRDPGLPAERTRLAWRRTVLSLTVVAVLAARLALPGGPVGALVAAAAMAGWVVTIGATWRRATAWTRPPEEPGSRTLPLVALATVGYALLGVVLVVLRAG